MRREYRIVEVEGEKVFIKAFYEKGIEGLIRNLFAPRGKKEFFIAKKLRNLSIPVPEPLGYGLSKKASFVVEKFIEGKQLKDVLEKEDRKEVLRNLVVLVKKLRDCCILHRDLHLGNIIIKENLPFLLDLHKTKTKKHFSEKDNMLNLAQLFSSLWGNMHDKEKAILYDIFGKEVEKKLEKRIKELKGKWIEKKEKRAFRNTSKIFVTDDKIFVKNEKEKRGEFVEIIKLDKKVKIERFDDHIRKYYKGKRRWKRAWKNHVVLLYMGLPIVPKAFFAKKPSLFSFPFIAMEDLKGQGRELDRYLDESFNLLSYNQRKEFIRSFRLFLVFLCKNGICHKDLKACNVFVLSDGNFRLLDVEDILFKDVKIEDIKRMLIQLNCSIPMKIGLKDRLRFFIPFAKDLNLIKKQLLREIINQSQKRKVVYEGLEGLKIETWNMKGRL